MSGGQSATATALKAFVVFCVNSGRLLHRNPFSLFNTLGKQEEETGHSRLVPSLRLITHSQSRGEKRCRSPQQLQTTVSGHGWRPTVGEGV